MCWEGRDARQAKSTGKQGCQVGEAARRQGCQAGKVARQARPVSPSYAGGAGCQAGNSRQAGKAAR